MKILAIETSCDETALAVLDTDLGQFARETVYSQIHSHRPFGGIVPEIATRAHFEVLPEQLKAWYTTGFNLKEMSGIGVTHGPGLVGCLALGIAFAQTLSWVGQKPIRGVNHLRAHGFSCFIPDFLARGKNFDMREFLPHLGLLASGGNTLLFALRYACPMWKFEVLAKTVDDAAGEALDKGARLLHLPYPGGPEIERLGRRGDPKAFTFPVAFGGGSSERKFSFSGLKTSLRYRLEKESEEWREKNLNSLCASYQGAVVEALVGKTQQILAKSSFASLGLCGGVANNLCLRSAFEHLAHQHRLPLHLPEQRHSGDNAAMIAFDFFMEDLLTTGASPKLDPCLTIEI